MADVYYLNSTNSALSGGADFDKQIDNSQDTPTTVNVSVAPATSEDSYGFSVASLPGLAQWPTGDWQVDVDVTTGDSHISLDIGLTRINSTGTVQEGPKFTSAEGSVVISAAQTYSWTFSSVSWSSGADTDRLRVDYRFTNSHGNMTYAVDILTDTNSLITTPFGMAAFAWLQMTEDHFIQPPEPVAVPYQ